MKPLRSMAWGLLALLMAVPALTAEDCSANCDPDGEWGCPGGCAISAPGPGPLQVFGYLVALEGGEVGYVLSGTAPAG